MTEPWLRGPIEGIEPHLMPVFHSFAQVREDLAHHTAGLTTEQVWHRTGGLPALGFHLRHIAHSVDRLVTYLFEQELTLVQINTLKAEVVPGSTLEDLLSDIETHLRAAEERLRTIPVTALYDARWVGKKRLPTNVIGLLVHLAEHTQRHLGQAITTAKLARERAAS
jgi:uncharacterized damage-inducible protein DinB